MFPGSWYGVALSCRNRRSSRSRATRVQCSCGWVILLVTARPLDTPPSYLQPLGHARERIMWTDWRDVSLFPHLKEPMVVGGILKGNALKSAGYSCPSRSHQAPDELIKA